MNLTHKEGYKLKKNQSGNKLTKFSNQMTSLIRSNDKFQPENDFKS